MYRTPSTYQFIPRVGRYAHQTNRRSGNTRENNARRIREYADDLELRDRTRGTDHSEFIVRLRDRAMRLHQLPVARPTVTQSIRTLDTTDLNPSPAQRRRQHSPPHAPVLLTDVVFAVNSGDETNAVSRMLIDLTVDAPPPLINAPGSQSLSDGPSTSPVSITTPSAAHTALRNRRRQVSTIVTDGDIRIDTMLRDGPLGIHNHAETTWIQGVINRYSPFMHTTHSLVNYPSRDVPDVELNSRWYRDRYRSNVMYVSGHVCLTSRARTYD